MSSTAPTRCPALLRSTGSGAAALLLLLAGCETSPADPKEQAAATDSGEQTETDTDTGPIPVDADGDGVPEDSDCDDTDPQVFPGATERCNGVDDHCDDEVDEGVQSTFYGDADEDGYGDPTQPEQGCEPPDGTVTDATDCDDDDTAVNPAADEVCNERDDDCDGDIDEDGDVPLYADTDGDGWGDASITASGCPEPGWTDQPGDCDDGDADAHPGMPSDMCDGVDSDCEGDVDEDSKAGWDLFSVNTGDGNVYDVDPATGALISVCPGDSGHKAPYQNFGRVATAGAEEAGAPLTPFAGPLSPPADSSASELLLIRPPLTHGPRPLLGGVGCNVRRAQAACASPAGGARAAARSRPPRTLSVAGGWMREAQRAGTLRGCGAPRTRWSLAGGPKSSGCIRGEALSGRAPVKCTGKGID